jgi:hypothetical protein
VGQAFVLSQQLRIIKAMCSPSAFTGVRRLHSQGFKNQTGAKNPSSPIYRELKSISSPFKTLNPNFIDKNQLTNQFDRLTNWFSVSLQFKIQILNKNNKPELHFSDFTVFQISQNLNFLNCNQPIFGKPKN